MLLPELYFLFYKKKYTILNICTDNRNTVTVLIDFFIELMPVICTFALISYYNTSYGEPLSAGSTFAMIALLNMLSGPLKVLSNLSRDKRLYDRAYTNVLILFDGIDKRPTKNYKNPQLETGRVHFETASFRINDGIARKAIKEEKSMKYRI